MVRLMDVFLIVPPLVAGEPFFFDVKDETVPELAAIFDHIGEESSSEDSSMDGGGVECFFIFNLGLVVVTFPDFRTGECLVGERGLTVGCRVGEGVGRNVGAGRSVVANVGGVRRRGGVGDGFGFGRGFLTGDTVDVAGRIFFDTAYLGLGAGFVRGGAGVVVVVVLFLRLLSFIKISLGEGLRWSSSNCSRDGESS